MSYVNILELIYPIDSIYISANSTSPADIVGGTWAQILNKCIRASNDTLSGGADTVTLTTTQIPSHSHALNGYSINWGRSLVGYSRLLADGPISVFAEYTITTNGTGVYASANTSGNTGGVVRTTTFPHTRIYIFGDAQPKRGWF